MTDTIIAPLSVFQSHSYMYLMCHQVMLLWGLPSAIVVLAPDQKGISSFQFPHPDIPLETTQRQLLVSILLHFIQGLWSASLSVITAESNKKVVAYQ